MTLIDKGRKSERLASPRVFPRGRFSSDFAEGEGLRGLWFFHVIHTVSYNNHKEQLTGKQPAEYSSHNAPQDKQTRGKSRQSD